MTGGGSQKAISALLFQDSHPIQPSFTKPASLSSSSPLGFPPRTQSAFHSSIPTPVENLGRGSGVTRRAPPEGQQSFTATPTRSMHRQMPNLRPASATHRFPGLVQQFTGPPALSMAGTFPQGAAVEASAWRPGACSNEVLWQECMDRLNSQVGWRLDQVFGTPYNDELDTIFEELDQVVGSPNGSATFLDLEQQCKGQREVLPYAETATREPERSSCAFEMSPSRPQSLSPALVELYPRDFPERPTAPVPAPLPVQLPSEFCPPPRSAIEDFPPLGSGRDVTSPIQVPFPQFSQISRSPENSPYFPQPRRSSSALSQHGNFPSHTNQVPCNWAAAPQTVPEMNAAFWAAPSPYQTDPFAQGNSLPRQFASGSIRNH